MQRKFLQSKIHHALVTGADLHYEGSIAIDRNLMEAAGISEFEAIHVWDVDNGARLETYVIPAPAGSGEVSLNGGAARHVQVGDELILATFAWLTEAEAREHKPSILIMGADNRAWERKAS
jgi:aspartate 1-decarboxylase